MSEKSLELFKKWFGIDLFDVDPLYSKSYTWFVHPYRSNKISVTPAYSIKKEAILKLINSEYFVELDNYDNAIFVFSIPPEHQDEWEEYIKEEKKSEC